MNNQMPGFGVPNNNCRCMGEIREMQRRISNLESRLGRLENAVFVNNWNSFNPFNNPNMINKEQREYTTGNYIL